MKHDQLFTGVYNTHTYIYKEATVVVHYLDM